MTATGSDLLFELLSTGLLRKASPAVQIKGRLGVDWSVAQLVSLVCAIAPALLFLCLVYHVVARRR